MAASRKAVYFDIDGTLWDRANYIPDSTKEAIRLLKEKGHSVMICSGRCRGYIHNEELLGLGFDGIVSGCGTMIEYHDQVLYYFRVPKDRAVWTVETSKRFGMRPILEGREYLYLYREDFMEDAYGQKLMRENGPRLRLIDETWGEWEFSKFSVDMRDADVQGCFAELSEYYDFLVHSARVAEIVPRGFDKARGMRQLSGHLGIPIEDTVAFGDGMNDMGMIRAAGIGVAMGNGVDALKSAADLVAPAMAEDGVYAACKTLGLI
ncbi:MAG: Cof-type HAD-IIB family hydrolase [Lachnospiraceae bacterium]|nr:Cof-type HAD-IIB family hydrolase [Lachnospiraceae bacterium]